MDLTWLGHACFRMRGREGVVLADPPDPKSGHAIAKTDAAIVTISHEHLGHSSLKSVGGEPVVLRGPGEYEIHEVLVTGIGTFHDDSKGSVRGRNTVFAIRLDDLVICHQRYGLGGGNDGPPAVRPDHWRPEECIVTREGLHDHLRAAPAKAEEAVA